VYIEPKADDNDGAVFVLVVAFFCSALCFEKHLSVLLVSYNQQYYMLHITLSVSVLGVVNVYVCSLLH